MIRPVLGRVAVVFGLLASACATTGPQVLEPIPSSVDPAVTRPETVVDVESEVQEPASGDMLSLAFTTPTGRPVRLEFPRLARSLGRANDGRLAQGRCLRPEGPGYVQRNAAASCGTDELVLLLMFALGEVLREYPDTPPVVIGALSCPEGGPLKPHRSHQSGRDVDLGLYAINGRPLGHFVELPNDQIDFEKTFFLMANLLATGRVRLILVNYALQPHLYRAAQAMGYDERQLAWIFQYPRGSKVKAGVIRHARGHKRHFHVRFSCPEGDPDCIDLP